MPFFSAVDYRRYAAECVRLAQQVADLEDKARLLDMAETFRELADKNNLRHRPPQTLTVIRPGDASSAHGTGAGATGFPMSQDKCRDIIDCRT